MALLPSYKNPPVTFPEVVGSVASFNSDLELPLKKCLFDIDYTGTSISEIVLSLKGENDSSAFTWVDNEAISADGTIIPNTNYRRSNLFEVCDNCTYLFEGQAMITASGNRRLHGYDANGNWVAQLAYQYVSGGRYELAFFIPQNVKYFSASVPKTDSDLFFGKGLKLNRMFGSAIYGGSYDAITGILESDTAADGSAITPVETQLAPAPIKTLKGENSVFCNTGDTTLQYIKIGG